MMHHDLESTLLEPVARYVKGKSFRWQESELAFYEYRIDLYAFSRREDLTVAVELKLYNWRRAVQQALIYQLCADHVYIAMPEKSIARVDEQKFCEYGIGLLSVTYRDQCRTVIPAHQSSEVRDYYRRDYVAKLVERAHV